jgi:hypothetical protein
MAIIEHVEVDTLRPGMSVVLSGQEVGRLEDVLPQPDGRHALRLITRRPDRRLIAIPIDWVRDVRDDRVELWVSEAQIDELPEYIPPIDVSVARERVQRALDEHASTQGAGIRVTDHDGILELHGTVADAAARANAGAVARAVGGVGPVRNLIGTRADPEMTATGYGYPWLHTLIERTTGLDCDDTQLARIEDIAEQKLVDMFDVAEEVAVANGRTRVLRQDLPLTKGMQLLLLEVVDISREFKLEPLLAFLADAGIRASFDEGLRPEIPRLMAALLIMTGRVVGVLESPDGRVDGTRPSSRALDRAGAILDLTL